MRQELMGIKWTTALTLLELRTSLSAAERHGASRLISRPPTTKQGIALADRLQFPVRLLWSGLAERQAALPESMATRLTPTPARQVQPIYLSATRESGRSKLISKRPTLKRGTS